MHDPASEVRRIYLPPCEYPGEWLWATPRSGLILFHAGRRCLASDSSAGQLGVALRPIKARTQAANQLQGMRLTAPEQLRHRLRGLSTKELVSVAARFRLADGPAEVPTATRFALRSRCVRWPAATRPFPRRSQS